MWLMLHRRFLLRRRTSSSFRGLSTTRETSVRRNAATSSSTSDCGTSVADKDSLPSYENWNTELSRLSINSLKKRYTFRSSLLDPQSLASSMLQNSNKWQHDNDTSLLAVQWYQLSSLVSLTSADLQSLLVKWKAKTYCDTMTSLLKFQDFVAVLQVYKLMRNSSDAYRPHDREFLPRMNSMAMTALGSCGAQHLVIELYRESLPVSLNLWCHVKMLRACGAVASVADLRATVAARLEQGRLTSSEILEAVLAYGKIAIREQVFHQKKKVDDTATVKANLASLLTEAHELYNVGVADKILLYDDAIVARDEIEGLVKRFYVQSLCSDFKLPSVADKAAPKVAVDEFSLDEFKRRVYKAKDYKSAIKYYEEATTKVSDQVQDLLELHRGLMNAFFATREYDKVLETYTEFLKQRQDDDTPPLTAKMANIVLKVLLATNQPQRVLKFYRHSVDNKDFVSFDSSSFSLLLQACEKCGTLDDATEIHKEFNSRYGSKNVSIPMYLCLMRTACNASDLNVALNIYNEMKSVDVKLPYSTRQGLLDLFIDELVAVSVAGNEPLSATFKKIPSEFVSILQHAAVRRNNWLLATNIFWLAHAELSQFDTSLPEQHVADLKFLIRHVPNSDVSYWVKLSQLLTLVQDRNVKGTGKLISPMCTGFLKQSEVPCILSLFTLFPNVLRHTSKVYEEMVLATASRQLFNMARNVVADAAEREIVVPRFAMHSLISAQLEAGEVHSAVDTAEGMVRTNGVMSLTVPLVYDVMLALNHLEAYYQVQVWHEYYVALTKNCLQTNEAEWRLAKGIDRLNDNATKMLEANSVVAVNSDNISAERLKNNLVSIKEEKI